MKTYVIALCVSTDEDAFLFQMHARTREILNNLHDQGFEADGILEIATAKKSSGEMLSEIRESLREICRK